MLRCILLLGRAVVVRRRGFCVGGRAPLTPEKRRQMLQENEAAKEFMEKIRRGRRMRQRIIAVALRRALAKEKQEELKFLRRYEANKAKATEELQKMKDKKELLSAEDRAPRVCQARVVSRPKKTQVSAEKLAQQKEREKKEEEKFFQKIEELKRRRELRLLATRKLMIDAADVRKKADADSSGVFASAPPGEQSDLLAAEDMSKEVESREKGQYVDVTGGSVDDHVLSAVVSGKAISVKSTGAVQGTEKTDAKGAAALTNAKMGRKKPGQRAQLLTNQSSEVFRVASKNVLNEEPVVFDRVQPA